MKKIYTLIAAALLIAGAASAQKKVNIRLQLVSPANGASVVLSTAMPQQVVVTNLGPGAIAVGDTLFVHDPFNQSGQIWYYINYTKAVGDTIQLNKSYTPSNSNGNKPFAYCVYGYVRSGANTKTDSTSTTPGLNCNNITFTGGVGVGHEYLVEDVQSETVAIYPNPAFGTVNIDFHAKNGSEVTARIIDLSGREVMNTSFGKAYVGQSGYKMDVTNLIPGVYFLEMRQEGVRAIGRITRQ